MKHVYKKADGGLTLIIVAIVIVLFLGWIINLSQRECKSNKDCGSEAYCGSDFSCHTYPTINKTVVQYNFLIPSVIIGIAIIIVAVIFNWSKIKQKEEKVAQKNNDAKMAGEKPKEAEETTEPYYKSDSNIKV